jgi:hypothetical protein
MSSNPIPIEPERAPFIPTTTPAIESANRLMGVRAHPGFVELIRLMNGIVQEARENTEDYAGWDPQMMTVLKVRQQVAKEFPQRVIEKMNAIIDAGVAEARTQMEFASAPPKSATDAVDQGDYVRQRVLQNFEEMDGRVAGSF